MGSYLLKRVFFFVLDNFIGVFSFNLLALLNLSLLMGLIGSFERNLYIPFIIFVGVQIFLNHFFIILVIKPQHLKFKTVNKIGLIYFAHAAIGILGGLSIWFYFNRSGFVFSVLGFLCLWILLIWFIASIYWPMVVYRNHKNASIIFCLGKSVSLFLNFTLASIYVAFLYSVLFIASPLLVIGPATGVVFMWFATDILSIKLDYKLANDYNLSGWPAVLLGYKKSLKKRSFREIIHPWER